MSESIPTSRQATAAGGAAQQPGGQPVVGDYLGCPASEATRAIRRAGLRPGLERSFGYPAQITGEVVAQEPAAGTQVARSSLVRIFVAAPGDTPDQHDASPAETLAASDVATVEPTGPDEESAGERLQAAASVPPRAERAAHRRKPRPAVLRRADDAESHGQQTALSEADPDADASSLATAAVSSEARSAEGQGGCSDAEIERASAIFSQGGGWRRAAWRGLPSWRSLLGLDGHVQLRRWLAVGAGGVAALWVLVAIVVALIGGHAPTSAHPGNAAPSRVPRAARADAAGRSAHRGERRAAAQTHRYAGKRTVVVVVTRTITTRPQPVAAPPVPAASEPQVAPSAAAGEVEQVGGGPFSP
jgi:PASTA domain